MDMSDLLTLGSKVVKWGIDWAYTTDGTRGILLFSLGFLTRWVYETVTGQLWKYLAVGIVVVLLLYWGYSANNPGVSLDGMVSTITNASVNVTNNTTV